MQTGQDLIVKKLLNICFAKLIPMVGQKQLFLNRFGFSLAQWETLAEMLIKHGMTYPVVKTARSEYGIRYCVDGPIETPCGDCPSVRTVWIVEEGTADPRLVTAYPVSGGDHDK